MKRIHFLFSAWVISLALPVSLFAQEAPPAKEVPGGLSSKKGTGKIFTAFHQELTGNHGLTTKVCMLARSYGGTQMGPFAQRTIR